jgi:predicted DNA-binding transcriptional regulator AlpA
MGHKKAEFTIPTNERLLTILEVGSRLGVSRDTVHQQIDDGLLERVCLSLKTPWITGSSLERFLEALREGRDPPK